MSPESHKITFVDFIEMSEKSRRALQVGSEIGFVSRRATRRQILAQHQRGLISDPACSSSPPQAEVRK